MFIKIFNHKRFTLLSVFLFIYVTTNLLDGERGLISYFEKQKTINELNLEKGVIENRLTNNFMKKTYEHFYGELNEVK